MSGLSYITTCSLCGQQFTHFAFADMLQNNLTQAGKVIEAFAKHIAEKHPQEEMKAQLAAQTFLGLLRLQHFTSQDNSANQMRDYQRWQIAEMVRATHVPDAKIVEQVSALDLPDEYLQRVIACVRLMRDIIEEHGPFAPKQPDVLNPSNPGSKTGKPQLVV